MLSTLFKSKRFSSVESDLKHDEFFRDLRSREFDRLDQTKQVYLDFTGGNLHSKNHLLQHTQLLNDCVLGNPHSTNPTSKLATKLTEDARKKVLSYFNAEDYHCIFTSNASGALKIVGECFPFESGHFLFFTDNHNSVNGIKEYCKNAGGNYETVKMQVEDLQVSEDELFTKLTEVKAKNKLFAYPAQSNVSGVKHSLDYISAAQSMGWHVLLDAAAFVPTSRLDLSVVQPDFVSVSFYKMFGYPTGIGCLLVKKSAFNTLSKRWFAGGTVESASILGDGHFLHQNHERYENGTINYLDLPAIKTGLEFIETIGIERINERVQSLSHYLRKALTHLEHSTGKKIVKIYGPDEITKVGGTIIMSFFNPDGSKIPVEKIESLANDRLISLRSGCFCNPGLDEINYCLNSEELKNFFATRDSGDLRDLMYALTNMRGSTRVSVGIATIKKDLDTFIQFVQSLKDQSI